MNRIYRTPEENFHNLPGFPYKLQYLDKVEGFEDFKDGLRISYLDEGPKDSELTIPLKYQSALFPPLVSTDVVQVFS